eukprot:1876963-Amphidinium_carterae.4
MSASEQDLCNDGATDGLQHPFSPPPFFKEGVLTLFPSQRRSKNAKEGVKEGVEEGLPKMSIFEKGFQVGLQEGSVTSRWSIIWGPTCGTLNDWPMSVHPNPRVQNRFGKCHVVAPAKTCCAKEGREKSGCMVFVVYSSWAKKLSVSLSEISWAAVAQILTLEHDKLVHCSLDWLEPSIWCTVMGGGSKRKLISEGNASASSRPKAKAKAKIAVAPKQAASGGTKPKGQQCICYCALCGSCSKDLLSDVIWALMKKAPPGSEEEDIAVGDSCELCYMVWQKAFSWLSFEQLCEVGSDQEHELHNNLLAAKARVKQKLPPLPGAAVVHTSHLQLEVSHNYKIASEKELSALFVKGKVSKPLLRSLTSLEIPSEQGGPQRLCMPLHILTHSET